jgi:Glyoxal oxidase N-terminus/Galactose oxidase-like, Early set domain
MGSGVFRFGGTVPSLDSFEEPEPEHPAYWPARSVVRTEASGALRRLVEAAGSSGAEPKIAEHVRRTLHDLGELDRFNKLTRGALLGDSKALERARRWLSSYKPRAPDTTRPSAPSDQAEPFEGLPSGQWLSSSAVSDLIVGAGFVGGQSGRNDALSSIQSAIDDVARSVAIIMGILDGLAPDLAESGLFDAFAHGLGDFDRFDPLPLDIGGCINELVNTLRQRSGSLAQASQASELELDDNTARIDSASPDPVCTGQRLTVKSRSSDPFIERSGVTIAFSPCGQLGADIAWSPSDVTVTVPSGAQSGSICFVRLDGRLAGSLAGEAEREIAGILGNCPWLGDGAETSIMLGALRQPLDNARCFRPVGGISVAVEQTPVITLFRAVTSTGAPTTNAPLPAPDDPISIEWEVLAASGSIPDVTLLNDGTIVGQSLPMRGSQTVFPARKTAVYSLEVGSTCGVVRGEITVVVLKTLRLEPPLLLADPGQPINVDVVLDQVLPEDTMVYVQTSPSQPTAGWVRVPAGQTQAPLTYTGVAPGTPGNAALSVVASSPGFTVAQSQVWVDRPLGDQDIVASRSGGTGQAAINVVGVHAALLPNGSVLLFAYDEDPSAYDDVNKGKSAVWDPASSQVQELPMSRNVFCSGHAFLGDGRLLVAGGLTSAITVNGWVGSRFGFGRGSDHDVHVFDGSSWTRVLPDMPAARWYPTCATLPDGRVLIIGGHAADAYNAPNAEYEIFDGASNSLVQNGPFLTLLPSPDQFDLYPFVHVLPGSSLFVHSYSTTWLVALNSSNEPTAPGGGTPLYTGVSPNTRTYNGQGACVMLPLDPATPTKAKVLVIGGAGGPDGGFNPGTPATRTAEIFEFDSTLPLSSQSPWRFTHDVSGQQTLMTTNRLMADSVLLPDGTVAIIGGAGGGQADDGGPPVAWIESFDPATETFSHRSPILVPRLYHSTALLLRDGSVMIAGSTGQRWSHWIHGGSQNELRIEIYRPPYMFRGPRPTCQLTTSSLKFTQPLQIQVSTGAASIRRVLLIRNGSTTHTNNMDQRAVGLQITGAIGTKLSVMLPPDASIAPPGPYILFVVDQALNQAPLPSYGVSVMLGP